MPETKNCSAGDFSGYDTMSTRQLQQLLREDASKSEGEESDTAAILYVMEVLARRRREHNEGKSPAAALESFKQEYDIQNNFISENREKDRNKHAKRRWIQGLAAVLALVILLFGSSVTANAFGVDLWETIAKWTKETFQFGYVGQTDPGIVPDGTNSEVYAGLWNALEQMRICDLKLPTWMPNGYVETQVEVFETPIQRFVVALYQFGDKAIQIKIDEYLDADPERIEQSDLLIEVYSVNGIDYHIFDNYGQLQAAWIVGSYECYITGSLSLPEIKLMIDSIEKG